MIKRLSSDVRGRNIGDEPFEIEISGAGWIVKTTEIGMYRVWDKATTGGQYPQHVTKCYSSNLGSWVVCFGSDNWLSIYDAMTE